MITNINDILEEIEYQIDKCNREQDRDREMKLNCNSYGAGATWGAKYALLELKNFINEIEN